MEKLPHRRMIPETFVHLLYEYLESQGLDPERILQKARPEGKPDSPGSFPIEHWVAMLDCAASHLQDSTLGLRLGQTITPRHVGVLGYVLLASPDLKGALQRLDRYQRLAYDVTPMERRLGIDHIDLVWGVDQGRPGPLVDETAITALVQFCRNITGRNLAPRFVHFINPEPGDLRPYTEYFRCPVKFAQLETVVRIDAAALDYPLRTADPVIIDVMERHAENLLAQLPREDAPIERVRKAITDSLRDGEPGMATIAARLGRTKRTLQRELHAAGSSFRSELNALRKEMALTYLQHEHLSILDIAMLLGYTEQSAFSRSFRQWTGSSPNEYRRIRLNERSRTVR